VYKIVFGKTIFLEHFSIDIYISLGFVQVLANWIIVNSQGKRMDVIMPMFWF
jgi:hypothetical protein